MTTAYISDKRYTEHDFPGHPEHAGRIEAVWEQLNHFIQTKKLLSVPATPASDEQILAIHSRNHLQRLVDVSMQDRRVRLDQDTYALPVSPEIARLSAGAIINAVDAVLNGQAGNAMAIARPPGHHATPSHAMGFCLLNNVAIGARHALNQHNLDRVLILDYDVHHGNGTQDAFYADASVLFTSIHQSPFYPGTGELTETGADEGRGFNLNVPVAAGHGDASYRLIFEKVIAPAAERFAPDLVLISAGFDAHWVDPLAGMRLSLSGYDWLARQCILMAEKLCDGKIIFVMEGGYDLNALAHGWRNIATALLDIDEISDPYGEAPNAKSSREITQLLDRVRDLHGPLS